MRYGDALKPELSEKFLRSFHSQQLTEQHIIPFALQCAVGTPLRVIGAILHPTMLTDMNGSLVLCPLLGNAFSCSSLTFRGLMPSSLVLIMA